MDMRGQYRPAWQGAKMSLKYTYTNHEQVNAIIDTQARQHAECSVLAVWSQAPGEYWLDTLVGGLEVSGSIGGEAATMVFRTYNIDDPINNLADRNVRDVEYFSTKEEFAAVLKRLTTRMEDKTGNAIIAYTARRGDNIPRIVFASVDKYGNLKPISINTSSSYFFIGEDRAEKMHGYTKWTLYLNPADIATDWWDYCENQQEEGTRKVHKAYDERRATLANADNILDAIRKAQGK
jgi:hypothetical protein